MGLNPTGVASTTSRLPSLQRHLAPRVMPPIGVNPQGRALPAPSAEKARLTAASAPSPGSKWHPQSAEFLRTSLRSFTWQLHSLPHPGAQRRDPGSNRGPSDLRSAALPAELSRLVAQCAEQRTAWDGATLFSTVACEPLRPRTRWDARPGAWEPEAPP